jgi:Ca2+-binding RTX toxin-like protein
MSNGYKPADFKTVLESVIEERGKTSVLFINGIQTDKKSFDSTRKSIRDKLNLKDWSDEIPGYQTSLEIYSGNEPGEAELFKAVHNTTQGNAIDNLQQAFADLNEGLFQPTLAAYRQHWEYIFADKPDAPFSPDSSGAEAWASEHGELDNFEGFKFLKSAQGLGILATLDQGLSTDKAAALIANFSSGLLTKFQDFVLPRSQTDLQEALIQYFSYQASSVSKEVNEKWAKDFLDFLAQDRQQNSAILMAHSQGNFFIEDGLLANPKFEQHSEKLRILGLGSPTNYSSLAGKYSGGLLTNTLDFKKIGLTNEYKDLVTYLQLPFPDGDSPEIQSQKLKHLLDFFPKIDELFKALVEQGLHDLNNLYLLDHPSKKDTQDWFQEYFSEVNSQGYYFQNRPQQVEYLDSSEGTDNGDWIEGSSINDNYFPLDDTRLRGKGGNDVLRGNQGNDYLIGGSGWDFLDGGEGNKDEASYEDRNSAVIITQESYAGSDIYRVKEEGGVEDILVNVEKISGSDYSDSMYGGRGTDIFYGRQGDDYFVGRAGNDRFYGQDGNDVGYGNTGNDYFEGGAGNDRTYGGQDNDTSDDAGGDDYFEGNAGYDKFWGGDGNDTAYGGTEDDELRGEGGDDVIYGGDGDDIVEGGLRWDFWKKEDINEDGLNENLRIARSSLNSEVIDPANFTDSTSTDSLSATSFDITQEENLQPDGNDLIYGGNGNDRIDGDVGNDLVYGNADDDELYGGIGEDNIFGGQGQDDLYGEEGDDRLQGNLGDDTASGGDGTDSLNGNDGNDILQGDNGNDNLSGDAEFDSLYGGNDADILSGGDDNDHLFGENGEDRLSGENGDDLLSGGSGFDTLNGNSGNDLLSGGSQNDLLSGDAGDDIASGNSGDDTLSGGDGDDLLSGGTDQDFLIADIGNDTLQGDLGNDTVNYNPAPSSTVVNIDETRSYGDLTEPEGVNLIDPFTISPGTAIDGFDTADVLRNQENIIGSNYSDTLIGNSQNNHIEAYSGNDLIVGGGGSDVLDGGGGTNIVLYGYEAASTPTSPTTKPTTATADTTTSTTSSTSSVPTSTTTSSATDKTTPSPPEPETTMYRVKPEMTNSTAKMAKTSSKAVPATTPSPEVSATTYYKATMTKMSSWVKAAKTTYKVVPETTTSTVATTTTS